LLTSFYKNFHEKILENEKRIMKTLNFRSYLFGDEVFSRLSISKFSTSFTEHKARIFTENFDKMILAIRIFFCKI